MEMTSTDGTVEPEDELASCGHPERFWKVEPDNATAWCALCAVGDLALQNAQLRAVLEQVEYVAHHTCPWCKGSSHKPDCPRQKALEE